MKIEQIKKWEIWGAVIGIIAGSLLHFVYEWSGKNRVVAIFGAVNESTWEHLKLAFWPTLIFAVIEWFVWGKNVKNFSFATVVKIVSMPIIIIGLFYGWLLFFQDNVIYDILIFVLAVIVGYILSYQVIKSKNSFGPAWLWTLILLAALIKFSLFTYFPVKNFLFRDPISGGYGIER